MGWVNTVIAAARRQAVDTDDLLSAAGIPASALERERWPIDHITRLWHAAECCTGDSGFGLKVGSAASPASLREVGFSLQSAATLRESFTLLQKYQRLISDGGRFQMLPGESATWVVYHPCQGQLAFSPHQIEAVLAAVVSLSRWLTGMKLQPLRAQFSQSRLGTMQGYRDVFDCPVDFEQAFSGLLVPNTLLDRTLPQADARLAEMHDRYTAARLAALSGDSMPIEELKDWLAANTGPRIPRRTEAARALGMSERTLARRLGERGYTFEGMLDAVRREKALAAVSDPQRDLAGIAQSLGFAEPSPFYRAFIRWTGMPPARWRRQQLAG